METTTAAPVASSAPAPSFLARHQFLIYRLFSLAGLMPVGAYVVVHLVTNMTILDSPATFQRNVDTIHFLGVFLPIVEWTFIFIPILFHAAVGWLIITGAIPNTGSYPYSGNIRYVLQRLTGIIALFFIVWHVIHMHQLIGAAFERLGGGQFNPHRAGSTAATAIQASILVQAAYVVGTLAVVYHLANGIWTAGITWGIWTTRAAQARANYICSLFGVILAVVGMSALWGMSTLDPEEARAVEEKIEYSRQLQTGELSTEEIKRPQTSPHID